MTKPNQPAEQELDTILNIKWGKTKIYGLGYSDKPSEAWWEIPDDVKAELKLRLEKWHLTRLEAARREAREDQIQQDFLCYSINLDVDESELIEVRDHQLKDLAHLSPKEKNS